MHNHSGSCIFCGGSGLPEVCERCARYYSHNHAAVYTHGPPTYGSVQERSEPAPHQTGRRSGRHIAQQPRGSHGGSTDHAGAALARPTPAAHHSSVGGSLHGHAHRHHEIEGLDHVVSAEPFQNQRGSFREIVGCPSGDYYHHVNTGYPSRMHYNDIPIGQTQGRQTYEISSGGMRHRNSPRGSAAEEELEHTQRTPHHSRRSRRNPMAQAQRPSLRYTVQYLRQDPLPGNGFEGMESEEESDIESG